MKRLLLGIPLAALALGLVLLLVRSFGQPTTNGEPSQASKGLPAEPERQTETHRGTPQVRPGPPVSPPGSIHLLVQSQGKGFPMAKVKVIREENRETMEFETDAQGFQTISDVPIGDYVIEGAIPRYIRRAIHTVVVSGRTSEVLLQLELGSRLEGRVFDPQGRPLPGTYLSLLNPEKNIYSTNALSTTSDAEGNYVIDGVPIEEFHLHVHHPRYKQVWKKNLVFRDANVTMRQDVMVEEGARLTGTVTDSEGKPVAGAILYATNEIVIVESSDASGRFTVYGLGSGAIRLKVQAKGYGTYYQTGLSPNTEGVEVRLARPGSVKGTLQAEGPPEHFQIMVSRFDATQGQELTLDALNFSETRGTFELSDLAPGRYRLAARADGWETLEAAEVYVQEGLAAAPATIKLARKK